MKRISNIIFVYITRRESINVPILLRIICTTRKVNRLYYAMCIMYIDLLQRSSDIFLPKVRKAIIFFTYIDTNFFSFSSYGHLFQICMLDTFLNVSYNYCPATSVLNFRSFSIKFKYYITDIMRYYYLLIDVYYENLKFVSCKHNRFYRNMSRVYINLGTYVNHYF